MKETVMALCKLLSQHSQKEITKTKTIISHKSLSHNQDTH